MNYSLNTTTRATTIGAAILVAGDYRTFNLDNGGIRLILSEVAGFDFPAGSTKAAEAAALTAANVEDYFDECFGAYSLA